MVLWPECLSDGSLPDEIYGDVLKEGNVESPQWAKALSERCILAPLNSVVNRYNADVIDAMPGDAVSYRSVDYLERESHSDTVQYPVELLNSINPPSLPTHELKLKKGVVVLLLRNLNVTGGMVNGRIPMCFRLLYDFAGTRLMVTKLGRRVIECKHLNGIFKGQLELLPRIKLFSDSADFPFTFARTQFPIRPAFAMSINKSQVRSVPYNFM